MMLRTPGKKLLPSSQFTHQHRQGVCTQASVSLWTCACRIPAALFPCHAHPVLRDPKDLLPDVHLEIIYNPPVFDVFVFP